MLEQIMVSTALVVALGCFWILLTLVAKGHEEEANFLALYVVGWVTSSWVFLYLLWR